MVLARAALALLEGVLEVRIAAGNPLDLVQRFAGQRRAAEVRVHDDPGGVDHGPQARPAPLDQQGERLTRQVLPVPAGVRRRVGEARQLLAAAVEGLADRIEQRPPRVPLRAGLHLGPVQHLVDLG